MTATLFVARAAAIPPDPTEDGGSVKCPARPLTLSAGLRVVGLPLVGSDVTIDASNARFIGLLPNCEVLVAAVPRSSWAIVSRPSGSAAGIAVTGTLTARLRPDRAGQYRVRFTACPGGCRVQIEDDGTRTVGAQTAEIVVSAVASVVLPPEVEPTLPTLPATSATAFSDTERNTKCQGGGGVVDPQWVTVNDFRGAQDYQLVEGRVFRSEISKKDNFLNHDSQDLNVAIRTDPPFRRLVSTKPEFDDPTLLGLEWERGSYPERFWPTPGDRISGFGYWIFDCGHEPFYTELHPPVGVAVHRPRAVQIPSSFRPAGFPNGFGTNVLAPGIVTDVWFNRNAGETTGNCSDTGLHQPARRVGGILLGGACIRAPSPVNRVFRFNVYLPRSPQQIAAAAGKTAPPVPLYVEVQGSGGPAPQIVQRESGGVRWLEVSIDLGSLSGSTYSRRILAAWAYPAADNWGARRWRLALQSLDVTDDGDCCGRGDGDWRFWVNTNNGGQEWTKLFDCDGCVHGTETFSASTRTGAALGPDLVLFPAQRIWVSTSGYEEDNFVDTNTGTVADLLSQTSAAGPHVSPSICSGDCAEYKLHYGLAASGVGTATLTPEARALADAYVISATQPPRCAIVRGGCVVFPVAEVFLDWHPRGSRTLPLTRARARATAVELPLFERQETEEFVVTDIPAAALRKRVEDERRQPAKIQRLVDRLRAELRAIRRNRNLPGEAEAVLTYFRQALPPDVFSRVAAP